MFAVKRKVQTEKLQEQGRGFCWRGLAAGLAAHSTSASEFPPTIRLHEFSDDNFKTTPHNNRN
jgi:hypothetical protein